MKLKDIEKQYNEQADKRKAEIRKDQNKFRRFWRWVLYFICYPWVWLFYNIRDWRSAVCVAISFTILSASVWAFYLAGLLCGWTSTDTGKWLIGIGSAVWAWWLSPAGSPFILLVVMFSIVIKQGFNLIRTKLTKK